MAEKVGFIGLGVMGRPMARNLIQAGNDLVVYNRSRAAVDELSGEGAEGAGNAGELAEKSDIVITMLPESSHVREVAVGEGRVLERMKEGSLFVDMSTISPIVSQEIARTAQEKGLGVLDAPVSGGDVAAREGTLSIMVGGSEEDFERARPLFEAVGKTVVHVGGPGAGQVVKAANQIVVAITFEAVSEALVLGSKAGADPAKILDVLSGGLAANRIMEVRRRNFLEHDFTPGFRVDLHHKDLGIALAAGREYGVPLPVTAILDQMLQALRMKGQGSQDHSALLTVIEDWAQHKIGQTA